MQDTTTIAGKRVYVCTTCGDAVDSGPTARIPGTITIVHAECLEDDPLY